MSTSTKIEWTKSDDGTAGATWNPVTGCDTISPGCDHCYARVMARRLKAMGSPRYQADGHPVTSGPGFAVTVHPEALKVPYRWRKPRLVFVNSMSDVFHARVGDDFIRDLFEVMADTPQHTYQVLTKRPDRALRLAGSLPWPDNVWLGVSAEDQRRAEIRIPVLLRIPSAVRFVSLEPLLGPVDLRSAVWTMGSERGHGMTASFVHAGDCCRRFHSIDWVITGGESGTGARPMHPSWGRALRDQCQEGGVPFFFKQRGQWTWERPPGHGEPHAYVRAADGRVAGEQAALDDGGTWAGVWSVGKGRAGRELDSQEWNEMPPTTLDTPLGSAS